MVLVDDANNALVFYSSMHQPLALHFLEMSEQLTVAGISALVVCAYKCSESSPPSQSILLSPAQENPAQRSPLGAANTTVLTDICCRAASLTNWRCYLKKYILKAGGSLCDISLYVDPCKSSNGPLSLYDELFSDSKKKKKVCMLIKQVLCFQKIIP